MRPYQQNTSSPGLLARSPVPPAPALSHQQQQQQQQQQQYAHPAVGSFPLRQSSLSSESSDSSQITSLSTTPRPTYGNNPIASESSSSIASTPRNTTPSQLNQARTIQQDSPLRQPSATMTPPINYSRDRSRHHSQGFFEPTLPTASHREPSVMNNSNLSASQIAAQAAMHVQNGNRDRRRSQTGIEQPPPSSSSAASRKPKNMAPIQIQPSATPAPNTGSKPLHSGSQQPGSGAMKSAATTAASAAYPRSPLGSPFMPFASESRPTSPQLGDSSKPEKEKSSRRKLFLKPNKLHISKDKDPGKTQPKTAGIYGGSNLGSFNHSTTSLADLPQTPATAIYSTANASTSTLVPSERGFGIEKEKEKHRHHFLSRQKNKLKDDHAIALSSASSNSRPIDPSAPQSLYSFAPSSPSLGSKSISGFDLRHGGRALREKKKEEKAAQTNFSIPLPALPNASMEAVNRPDATELSALFGPTSNNSTTSYNNDLGLPSQTLTGFGLQNMGIDDAWPLLKARLLNIFEGEDLRTPIEDFNRLATAHMQRTIARRAPGLLIDDIRELFNTGFASLDMTLRTTSDDRLVLQLVETWSFVFGTILPFMQAVFLPLDLEFKGQGTLLKDQNEATEFWNAALASLNRPGTAGTDSTISRPSTQRLALDVRTLVLHSFRSHVILPRHETLLAIFSRLSLDTIATPSLLADLPTPPPIPARPGTAASSGSAGHIDPSSYNSQGSTLLDSSTAGSFGARSRATSNTSAGSFHSLPTRGRERAGTNHSLTSALPPLSSSMVMDSGRVTATAARMLQCVSVLAGLGRVGEDDESEASARRKMERLAKELKLNWLGRSRMGRDRRGLVGTKVRGPIGVGIGVGA